MGTSDFFDIQVGHHSGFLSLTAVTSFQGEPLCWGVRYMGVGKFCKDWHLSRKWYEI